MLGRVRGSSDYCEMSVWSLLLMFSLLALGCCRSTSSREVTVLVERRGEGLEVRAGPLLLLLQGGEEELEEVLGQEVRQEVLELLGGTLYTGSVQNRCSVQRAACSVQCAVCSVQCAV